jgi:hypothetical protein
MRKDSLSEGRLDSLEDGRAQHCVECILVGNSDKLKLWV